MAADRPSARPGKARLLLFAFGDFAFNLHWQSVMLFLLFYYSDALSLPMGVAATTYLVASVWDGIANFGAGLLIDRHQHRLDYGRLLALGAIPLGASFVLAYLPPPVGGALGVAFVLACHLLFRTAYAIVNVGYLAMSARISPDPEDRALVAGARMLSGSAAAVVVALGTLPIGRRLWGGGDDAHAFFAAAMVFAAASIAILLLVGMTYRETVESPARPVPSLAALFSLWRNRAFVTLIAAMVAMIVAVTMINKSVLYLFKYLANDADAGQLTLAAMALVSAISIPMFMLVSRVTGLRRLWLATAGVGIVLLFLFAALNLHRAGPLQLFLIAMQVMIVGLNFVFWAMLPNTIEYGERETGTHVEAAVFGMAALVQRVGIGIATAIFGWSFTAAGYVANVRQEAATMAGMRAAVIIVPLAFLALSCVAMALNPLGGRLRTAPGKPPRLAGGENG
ncbi:MAG TPA: MFS transporter [Allosphingosinicella sp.]|nr:MFS transporter [Allosphingosinicella sp.]